MKKELKRYSRFKHKIKAYIKALAFPFCNPTGHVGIKVTVSLCFQDMITALKAALSGSLETVILGLMKSTSQYDASEIRGSIKVNGLNSIIEDFHCPLVAKCHHMFCFSVEEFVWSWVSQPSTAPPLLN